MKRNLLITILLLMPFLAGAQALKGSYFLDNSLNRHEMNPAFAPRSNYFQLAGIGNLSLGAYTNLDIPTLLYPTDNGLKTFLHKDVSVKQFGRSLAKNPSLDVETDLTLLSFGFYTEQHSYWTFDLGARVMADVDLPRDLFMFLKKGAGTSGESYNIGNVNAYASAALQAALGYSRDIIDGLRVGAKVKFIAPVAYASVNLDNVNLTTGKEKWNLKTEGYANIALQGLEVNRVQDEVLPELGFDMNKFLANKALAGFGWAFDLGAEYRLEIGSFIDGITFSAAMTDLGAIHYSKEAMNSFKTEGSLDWVGFQGISLENADVEASLDEFVENAENLLNLSETPEGKRTRSAMPKYYVGVEMPLLNDLMSVGFLYSGRIGYYHTRHELTASYNLNPCKWFALGINYSFLNTARALGWILEFTPKVGPTFYIGGDYLPLGYAHAPLLEDFGLECPEFLSSMFGTESWVLPMSMRLNLNFGIAFALGAKNAK